MFNWQGWCKQRPGFAIAIGIPMLTVVAFVILGLTLPMIVAPPSQDLLFSIDLAVEDPNAPIDIAQALYQSLSDQIHIDAHDTSDTAVGRRSLPNIARLNANAMIGSVSA